MLNDIKNWIVDIFNRIVYRITTERKKYADGGEDITRIFPNGKIEKKINSVDKEIQLTKLKVKNNTISLYDTLYQRVVTKHNQDAELIFGLGEFDDKHKPIDLKHLIYTTDNDYTMQFKKLEDGRYLFSYDDKYNCILDPKKIKRLENFILGLGYHKSLIDSKKCTRENLLEQIGDLSKNNSRAFSLPGHVFYVIKNQQGKVTVLDQGGLSLEYKDIVSEFQNDCINYIKVPWKDNLDENAFITGIHEDTGKEVKVPMSAFGKSVCCRHFVNFVDEKTEELRKEGKNLDEIVEFFGKMKDELKGNRPLSEIDPQEKPEDRGLNESISSNKSENLDEIFDLSSAKSNDNSITHEMKESKLLGERTRWNLL